MTTITLKQANTILDAIIKRGAEMDLRPISAVVVDAGCIVKAFQKEDGASISRFEMAYGKCYAALSLGRSSSLVKVRQKEKPEFVEFLIGTSADRLFAEGGGRLIRDTSGVVIGAVGVTGDTEENDEDLAAHGIHAAGLKIDEDCEGFNDAPNRGVHERRMKVR
jgi:uncharacterized protein GlcG (DUF336 family)